jgi:predicted nucleotide-binding protein (sugar kinase/HSP70/actin superfamily)
MPRVTYLNKVYNSADCLITPNSIITRTIGEAIQSDLPIIAQNPCSATHYTCDFNNSNDLSDTIIEFCQDMNEDKVRNNNEIVKADMALENYSRQMNLVYEEILEGG